MDDSGNGRVSRQATVSLIGVVDDDESVRESLPDLLAELGLNAKGFASAEDFLLSESFSDTRCLILDIAMPGMTGPDLQRELQERGVSIPIIFITAQVDENLKLQLVQSGALTFPQGHLILALARCMGQCEN